MEKLFKLVCANFALKSRKPLSCHEKLENRVDDANVIFSGMYIDMVNDKETAIKDLAKFLEVSVSDIHRFFGEYKSNNCYRFKIKKGLIKNGLKL